MTTKQVEFTEDELLASHDYVEPLVVRGVRCHGGFDDEGTYVSPRTATRLRAIDGWNEQRAEQFGTPQLDIGLETWPEHFPNVEQSRFLLRHGVSEPIVTELTRIGTVEGFGAMLRYSPMPEFRSCFADDISGTAIDHLGRGLYEAHARDEAGFEDEAGHKGMWFAARDLAFEDPVSEDQTAVMLERMGLPLNDPQKMAQLQKAAMDNRLLPADIPFELESLVARMIRLLFIEISAFHVFSWAEDLLVETDLVAGEGDAARLVSYIRQDEAPHVGYLTTVLSEMRDRDWQGEGRTYEGTEMIDRIWRASLDQSVGAGRQDMLSMLWRELEHGLADHPDRVDLLDEMLTLGTVHRLDDGTWAEETDQRTPAGGSAGGTA